jgi:hypothetical protein
MKENNNKKEALVSIVLLSALLILPLSCLNEGVEC